MSWLSDTATEMPTTQEMGFAMLIYDAVILGVVSVLAVNLIGSLLALRRLDRFTPTARGAAAWPRISVLIPARNEAATIQECLNSLLNQDYPNCEILVLDDESDDATKMIVQDIAQRDPRGRLRLLAGGALPPGWLGKCHACAQLAAAATGDYLLFTDADTTHGHHSLANALAVAESWHVGLVSVLPRQRAMTPPEQLLLPLLPFNILTLLPVGLVRRRPEPSLSAGIGQFLFFRRSAYIATGGHAAVRDRVLDDVELARGVKAAGFSMALMDGGTAVRCRMYTSYDAIWRGFSKNLFDFYGRSPLFTVVAVLLQAALYVAPPLLALLALLLRQPWPLFSIPAATYGLALGMRLLLAGRVGDRGTDLRRDSGWLSALVHPIGMALQCAITLNSMRWGLTGRMQWKGRVYPAKRASG
ncbi:MAG: glycosyltransferase [Ktedonobacterales bacterium]|nr:glycosyltransferase [Ktedonobacterales bacterium]